MAQQTPYIGSKISLISKLDIRYEGILYTVDSKESTIALSKVRSFGTEDRNAAHVVPPQTEVYDYIIFKANDIKDLIVCETPKPAAPGLTYDPAILSVSQADKPAPAPVGSERPVSATATRRTSTPRSNRTPQQQSQSSDNKQSNSAQRQGQGSYQNRNHPNTTRQQGYDNNRQDKQQQQQQPQQQRTYNQNQPRGNPNPRGAIRNTRGGTRPHGTRNNGNIKFDSDYDFDKAYQQYKETVEAIIGDMSKCNVNDDSHDDTGSVKTGDENEIFYDKNKSFFDSISCEALEKEEGKNTRPDWRKERLTNQETFGQQSVRSYGYRRGGGNYRGGNYRGNMNYRGGNNYHRGGSNNYRGNGREFNTRGTGGNYRNNQNGKNLA